MIIIKRPKRLLKLMKINLYDFFYKNKCEKSAYVRISHYCGFCPVQFVLQLFEFDVFPKYLVVKTKSMTFVNF